MDLFAQPPLGPDAVRVANDQHADHQLGINRGSSSLTVEWAQVLANARKIDEAVDRTKQVISRNMPLKAELVKERFPSHRPLTHHHQHLSRYNADADSDQSHDFKREFFNIG